MACPTCNHTMQMVYQGERIKIFHCPRCGTMMKQYPDLPTAIGVPKIVERSRAYSKTLDVRATKYWYQTGMDETIFPPEQRHGFSVKAADQDA